MADAYPVIGEKNSLTRIDQRHVTRKTIALGRDPTADLRLVAVALEAGGLRRARVRRCPGVGVVTVHATQRSVARLVTFRLHDPDRLESGQVRNLGNEWEQAFSEI